MKSDKQRTNKHTLRSIAAAVLSLLIICSAMAAGLGSAFAAGEEALPPAETPTEAPQPKETPASTETQQPTAESESSPQTQQVTQVSGVDCAGDEIIVKFKDAVSVAGMTNTLNSVESSAVQQLPAENLVVSEVPEGETVQSFIETMDAMPNVEYAQPNYIYRLVDPAGVSGPSGYSPEGAATDPYAGNQWYLSRIGVYNAWDITMGSPDIRVAVIDTGVDADHPDLAGQIVAQADTVDNDDSADDDIGHGTHVAGIIAANANNGIGVAGVAPGVKLIAVDVFTKSGSDSFAYTTDVVEGITFAKNNLADVINLSLGSYTDDWSFEEAVNGAVGSGIPVVCAAGNDATGTAHYPSDYEASIGVIATNWNDTIADYSNYGNAKDISAPGGDSESYPYWDSYIISTYNNGGYVGMTGTSMAAPVVSGVVALMLSANPALSVAQVKGILYATAAELGTPGKDMFYGDGRVDAYYAVAAAKAPVHVTSVGISSESESLAPGNTVALGTTVLPGNTTFPKVVWSSSNEAVATVDRAGTVTAVNGGGAVITATADGLSDTCNIAVTAPQYTVTFDSRGGSPVSSVTVAGGASINASPPTYMAGYAFGGWYPTPQFNTAPVSFPYVVTGNATLYALWAAGSFTVSFDSQGGNAVPAQTVPYNGGISQPAAPYKTGCSFAGWYREPGCVTPWSFGVDMVQGDTTLYAKWQTMGPYLANVYLSAGSLSRAFSATVYSYKIYLGENEPGVMITPEREYAGASMTINGKVVASTYVSLANGKSATVTVKTKYGRTAKTYKFAVTRTKSGNNNLASMTATAGALSQPFDPNVTNYTLALDENTKSTTIRASAANPMARVSRASNKVTLNNGQSRTVKIAVRAQSGAKKYYIVTVVRAAASNANLKSLKAAYMSPGFNPNIADYSVTLPANKSSAAISAKSAGYKAAVYINGAKRSSAKIVLANGQSAVVRITIVAQAGNTKDYYITVSRP